jgi:hypothetical protein
MTRPPSPTRRRFLKTLTTTVAAVGAGPTLFGMSDKSGRRLPIVGSGAYTYEVHHDWGELPAALKYGNTHGVCVDAQQHLYVHHTVHAQSESRDTMVVFDEQGRFVRSWGPQFAGGAHGLHLVREGSDEFLFLCDTRRAIVAKVTTRGEVVWELGYPHESERYPVKADGSPAMKYSPTNVAVAPGGDIYVADGYGSSFINQYTSRGRFIRTFGGKGTRAGQLDCPHGLMVDTRGGEPVLLVADRSNRRLQTFSLEGAPLDRYEGFPHPCHFAEHHGIVVVPDLHARVTLIDRANEIVAQLGEAPADSWPGIRSGPRDLFPEGRFVCPHSACFDQAGNIYVVEWVEVGRVTKLRRVSS